MTDSVEKLPEEKGKPRKPSTDKPPVEPETKTMMYSHLEESGRGLPELGTVELNEQESGIGVSERETLDLLKESVVPNQPVDLCSPIDTFPLHIGKYKIEKLLGQGGFGKVYLAHDPIIDRSVAIKMYAESDFSRAEVGKQRFFREAKAIGQLDHPNIIAIHDASEYDGVPYLVVEYLAGHDLADLMEHDRLPPTSELLGLMITICGVLDYAHGKGVIHRDLKPANIFYTNSGTVKLMDFGIAKINDTKLTQTGMIVGTLFYMSPEQLNGQELDGRADIYSMGVLLYELFSLKLPYGGETITQVIRNIILSQPHPFQPIDRHLPSAMAPIIEKAMAKEVSDRYQSASELAKDLSRVKQSYDRETSPIRHETAGKSAERAGREGPAPGEGLKSRVGLTSAQEVKGILDASDGRHQRTRSIPLVDDLTTTQSTGFRLPRVISVFGFLLIFVLAVLYFTVWEQAPVKEHPIDNVTLPPTETTRISTDITDGQSGIGDTQKTPRKEGGDSERESLTRDWQLTVTADTSKAYELFIERYSRNSYADSEISQAKQRLERINAAAKKADSDRAKRDLILMQWSEAEKKNTCQSIETFLAAWSNDPLASEQIKQAREKLDDLNKREAVTLEGKLAGGPILVTIPGGSFIMGDSFGDGDQDEPSHRVTISSFRISRYEVSLFEFNRFCDETHRAKSDENKSGLATKPVTGVTWFDAIEYCNWLSKKNGFKPCYSVSRMLKDIGGPANHGPGGLVVFWDCSANGFRLPTEAEWEYAAREGGKKVKFGHGRDDEAKDRIVYDRNSSSAHGQHGPRPIGSLPPNSLELHDMSGNVWEWCWDWYGVYSTGVDTQKDPRGPAQGNERVIRGGSWKNVSATYVRAANRSSAPPTTQDNDIGFRLVRSLSVGE